MKRIYKLLRSNRGVMQVFATLSYGLVSRGVYKYGQRLMNLPIIKRALAFYSFPIHQLFGRTMMMTAGTLPLGAAGLVAFILPTQTTSTS